MSATTDKIQGQIRETAGRAEQAVGEMLDDPKLRAEGLAHEAAGKAQKDVGKGKAALKKAIDDI